MIPVRYMCSKCGEDLGVYWQGVGDENEPKPKCICGNKTNFFDHHPLLKAPDEILKLVETQRNNQS